MLRNPFYPDPVDYNCSGHSQEYWEAQRNPLIVDGTVCIFIASVCFILYFACVLVMCDRALLRSNTWKIMCFTGFMDLGGIVVAGHLTGLFYIRGELFCTSPVFNYVVGEFAMGFWISNLFNVVTIGLQRCSEVSSSDAMKSVFRDNNIYFWMAASLFAMWLVMCTTHTTVFNAAHGNWFYTPFIYEDHDYEVRKYNNIVHPSVNCSTAVLLTFIYGYLCIKMTREMRTTSVNTSVAQKKLVLQSIFICASTALTCYVYIYMQFCSVPYWLVYTATIAWLMSHGLPGIIYLSLNSTIRRRIARILRLQTKNSIQQGGTLSVIPQIRINGNKY